MRTALITHADCLLHEMGPQHPECSDRLHAVLAALAESNLLRIDAPLVDRAALDATHAPDYVQHIFDTAPNQGYATLDPDTRMNPHTLNAAKRAAGAVIEAVDRVMTGEISNAFCAVRPCGHHATYDQAMGFCIFNNVAVGARHAIKQYGFERVAILDFDVHHGNGSEDIFHDDPRVMLCSSFQHPFYPGSGAYSGNDHIIATPLAAHSGSAAFRAAIMASWLPALEKFKPQFIFISAGFDAHADDPLAQLNLHEDDYTWVTEQIMKIANRFADGRIVSVLEGGYHLGALGKCAAAHVAVLSK